MTCHIEGVELEFELLVQRLDTRVDIHTSPHTYHIERVELEFELLVQRLDARVDHLQKLLRHELLDQARPGGVRVEAKESGHPLVLSAVGVCVCVCVCVCVVCSCSRL